MRSESWGVAILGLICGLGIGFILANFSSRLVSERPSNNGLNSSLLPAQTGAASTLPAARNSQSPPQLNQSENDLSEEELQQIIQSAEKDPGNLPLQRNLGLALFRYAVLEQKRDLLPNIIRILERAEKKNQSQDTELTQTLGDALFLQSRENNSEKMELARSVYQKALTNATPAEADLLVDIGLTFFYQKPSNPAAAIASYNRALLVNPNHEKGLECLVSALLKVRQTAQAASALEKLHQVNPQNEAYVDLKTSLNQQQLSGDKSNRRSVNSNQSKALD